MRESTVVTEWKAEAKAEGKAEGMINAKRADLLRLLGLKFPGMVPSDLVTTIEAQADIEGLTQWFDTAFRAESLDAFRAAIAP